MLLFHTSSNNVQYRISVCLQWRHSIFESRLENGGAQLTASETWDGGDVALQTGFKPAKNLWHTSDPFESSLPSCPTAPGSRGNRKIAPHKDLLLPFAEAYPNVPGSIRRSSF